MTHIYFGFFFVFSCPQTISSDSSLITHEMLLYHYLIWSSGSKKTVVLKQCLYFLLKGYILLEIINNSNSIACAWTLIDWFSFSLVYEPYLNSFFNQSVKMFLVSLNEFTFLLLASRRTAAFQRWNNHVQFSIIHNYEFIKMYNQSTGTVGIWKCLTYL